MPNESATCWKSLIACACPASRRAGCPHRDLSPHCWTSPWMPTPRRPLCSDHGLPALRHPTGCLPSHPAAPPPDVAALPRGGTMVHPAPESQVTGQRQLPANGGGHPTGTAMAVGKERSQRVVTGQRSPRMQTPRVVADLLWHRCSPLRTLCDPLVALHPQGDSAART